MNPSTSSWELCKENVQPLKSGRKVDNLRLALQPSTCERSPIEQQQRDLELAIRDYSGDDPLLPWCAYVEWIQQNFPNGGKAESLMELLRNCMLMFKDDARYKNDSRFVQLCLLLADLCSEAVELFQYMFKENIGIELACFFSSWAECLENVGNVKEADRIFNEGIRVRAEPYDALLFAYKQFVARFTRRKPEEVEESTSPASDKREAFSALRGKGKHNRVGVQRTGNAVLRNSEPLANANFPSTSRQNKVFDVYCDTNECFDGLENMKMVSSVATSMPLVHDEKKENERKPGKWTENKLKTMLPPQATGPKFEVFVEEEAKEEICTSQSKNPMKIPGLELSARKKEAGGLRRLLCNAVTDKNQQFLNFNFCYRKLYSGTKEVQFEELRASKWRKQHELLEKERRLKEKEDELNKLAEELFAKMAFPSLQEATGESAEPQPTVGIERENLTNRSSGFSASNSPNSLKVTKQTLSTSTGHTMTIMREIWNNESSLTQIQAPKESVPVLPSVPFVVYEAISGEENEVNTASLKVIISPRNEEENVAVNEEQMLESDENQTPLGNGKTEPAVNQPGILDCCDNASLQEIDCEDQDILAGIRPLDDLNSNGIASTTFLSSTIFFSNTNQCSTPSTQNPEMKMRVLVEETRNGDCSAVPPSQAISTPVDQQEIAFVPSFGLFKRSMGNKSTPGLVGLKGLADKRDLSAISETSREYNTKSSSSSGTYSSTAASWKSQQFSRSKIRDLSALAEPLSIAELGDHPNPFDTELIQMFLDKLAIPLVNRTGYINMKGNLPRIKNELLVLGQDMLLIKSSLGNGAYGKVYSAIECGADSLINIDSDDDPPKKVCKIQTPACPWEFYISTELYSRIKKLKKSSDPTCIMHASRFYMFNDGSIFVTDYLSEVTLLELVNIYSRKRETFPECLVLYFSLEMLHILDKVHSANIIHADFKPDNLLVVKPPSNDALMSLESLHTTQCLQLLDYGRSIDMTLYPAGTSFDVRVKTDAFECVEMVEGKPWTYQTDFYGLACCIHVMLFGCYLKPHKKDGIYRPTSAIKRYWCPEWNELFKILMNIRSCAEQPDIPSLISLLQNCLLKKQMLEVFPQKIQQLEDMMKTHLH